MAEDWRAKIVLEEDNHGPLFVGWLRDHKLEEELAEKLRGRVAVSQDENTFFLYAESREQAEAAIEVVRSFLREHDLEAEIDLKRWHEVEESWEDPDVPLPETPEQVQAERERLRMQERRDSTEAGMDEWEVQVELPDHHSTRELADKLEVEGLQVSRRWRYLLVPVASEQDGRELAERIRREAPAEALIAVAGSYGTVVAEYPGSGFSLFGGLGA
jgi:hypothetical protein